MYPRRPGSRHPLKHQLRKSSTLRARRGEIALGFGGPDGTGDINSPRVVGGRAWGLAEGGATRAFSGPLSLGQTFSIDYDD